MTGYQKPGSSSEYAEFPDIEAQIGENPARFLDRELLGQDDLAMLTKARIRGIQDPLVAAKWLEVEHRLDRGPRSGVVNRLEQRARELQEDERTLDELLSETDIEAIRAAEGWDDPLYVDELNEDGEFVDDASVGLSDFARAAREHRRQAARRRASGESTDSAGSGLPTPAIADGGTPEEQDDQTHRCGDSS